MKKKLMKNDKIAVETKTAVTTSQKVTGAIMMVAAVAATVGFVAGALLPFLREELVIVVPDPVKEEVVKELPAYAPGSLLVKFTKDVIDPVSVIQEIFAGDTTFSREAPPTIYDELERWELTPTTERLETADQTVTVTLQLAEAIIKPSETYKRAVTENSVIDNIGLDRWWLIEVNEDEADVFMLQSLFYGDDRIEVTQPDYEVEASMIPNDPYYSSSNSWNQGYDDLWGLKPALIDAQNAWDISQGSGVTVAVVDSGVDYTHPDIDANMVPGYDFVNDDNDPMDDQGHGTHVAGTIAAEGNNAQGIIGVAYEANIMPIKILNEMGKGNDSDVLEGLYFAADHDADVINNSWGSILRTGVRPALEDAVNYAHAKGSVVVFAAGNEDDDVSYYSPNNQDNVITVSSVDHSGFRSNFSNHGEPLDVAAPGGDNDDGTVARKDRNILSLRADSLDPYIGATGYIPGTNIVGTNYYRASGTSMAAPHVSGLAALILANNPSFTNEDVRSAMTETATDKWDPGKDILYGYGIINAFGALQVTNPTVAHLSFPYEHVMINDSSVEIRGQASGPTFIRYTVDYGEGKNPSSWTQISTSTTAVTDSYGLMGTLDISDLIGFYTIRLTVEASDQTYVEQNTFRAKWPFYSGLAKLYAPMFSSIVLGDVDPDYPGLEAVMSAAPQGGGFCSPTLVYIFHEDGTLHPNWNPKIINEYYCRNENPLTPAIGDVNNDGIFDIVITTNEKVHVFDINGDYLPSQWPRTIDKTFRDSATLADLDQDGLLEVIMISNWDKQFYVWDHEGNIYNTDAWPKTTPLALSQVAIGDLSVNASYLAIVVGGGLNGDVHIWNKDGYLYNGFWPQSLPVGYEATAIALADLDLDGRNEIIVAAWNASLSQARILPYKTNGTLISGDWTRTFPGFIEGLAIGNLNGSGAPEIVFSPRDTRYVYALSANGTDAPGSWPFMNPGLDDLGNTPVIGDIDRDGNVNVIFGSRNSPQFFALDASGIEVTNNFPFKFNLQRPSGQMWVSPTIGDMDRDGNMEILQPAWDGYIYKWEMNSSGAVQKDEWPMVEQGPGNSNMYGDDIPGVSIFVNDDYSGVETGAPDQPFNTIAEAYSIAGEGDTLLVAPGTYISPGYIPTGVKLIGESPTTTKLNGSTWLNMGAGSTLQGFSVNNTSPLINGVMGVTIQNNIFANGYFGGIAVQNSDALIQNNTIHDTDGLVKIGIIVWYQSGYSYPTVKNNIVYNNAESGIYLQGTGTQPDLTSLITYNTLYGEADFGLYNFTLGEGHVLEDPMFVNEAGGDYHLMFISPSVDSGDPNDSYVKEPEPNGDRINMGAYGNTSEAASSEYDYAIDISSVQGRAGQWGLEVPVYLHVAADEQPVRGFHVVLNNDETVDPFLYTSPDMDLPEYSSWRRYYGEDDDPKRVEVFANFNSPSDYFQPGGDYHIFSVYMNVGAFSGSYPLTIDVDSSFIRGTDGNPLPEDSVQFLHGKLTQLDSEHGDINLNGIPYEVGDVVLFGNYIANGDSALDPNPDVRQQQYDQSDINWNCAQWENADLQLLIDIVSGDSDPVTSQNCN